ncbi:MAG TPA: ABC transporter permease, partial [Candidatus Tenderia electrophaga]|nr:ABC transporter permease [Candidatus Tenderia electrophaga]
MTALRLGLRQLWRDWRAGELTVLLLALIVAVASVSSVNFFTNRIQLALASQSNDLLGGDLVYSSSNPIADEKIATAVATGLKTAATVEFPTMVLAADASQLVALKAVSHTYPLRGRMHIASELFTAAKAVDQVPAPGSVWLANQVLTQLGLKVGDRLTVGAIELVVAAVLISEPEQSGGMLFGFAPRLLMNIDDLPRTQLLQPASRVSYRLLMAGETDRVAALQRDWQKQLGVGERLNNIKDSRPQVQIALQRAEAFLGLAALVSVLLAAAAVAMAA